MTGHRVERFHYKTAATVRHHAPWAAVVVHVGSIWVAYESADQAMEEHGGAVKSRNFGATCPEVKGGLNWKLFHDAKRRGELA